MKAAVLCEANTPLQIEEINEGFTAMRTGRVARGVVVFN